MPDSDGRKGRVTKVIMVDSQHQPVAATSFQEPDDPFTYGGVSGLVEPPYQPERLNKLAEMHSTHSAALEQKAMDIAATGWEWQAMQDGAPPEQIQILEDWFTGLADPDADESMAEILLGAWLDVETIGYSGIELARDSTGKVQKVFSCPGHTLRFHKSGQKIAQGPSGKNRVWFKRWTPNSKSVIDRKTGKMYQDLGAAKAECGSDFQPGNELLILRKPTRRKSWYGVPGYVSALGWVFLSLAARDDNIFFFQNHREPRWCVIMTNLEEDQDLEQELESAFNTQLDSPHRNLFIPIEGDGKITFQKMTDDAKDISFDKLQERASNEILLAHRVPPDRLGSVRVGPLGGNATMAASRVYKEGVVATSQMLLAERINRFVAVEGPVPVTKAKFGSNPVAVPRAAAPSQAPPAPTPPVTPAAPVEPPQPQGQPAQTPVPPQQLPGLAHRWVPKELDITEETEDAATVTEEWTANLIRLDEARKKLKLPPVGGSDGKKFLFQLVPAAAGAAASGAAAQAGASQGAHLGLSIAGLGKSAPDPRADLAAVDARIRELIGEEFEELEEDLDQRLAGMRRAADG